MSRGFFRGLTPSAARAVLRKELWRRARWWSLVQLGLLVAVTVTVAVRSDALVFGEDARAIDIFLQFCQAFVVLAMSPLSMIYSRRLRPLVGRLPVDPAVPLQAMLQIVLGWGGMAFAAMLLVEYVSHPPMMQPSFGGRLNPVETTTLNRLPGIPLLRFVVDDRVSYGLSSEPSLAAMLARETPGTRIDKYGTISSRREPLAPAPLPGELIADLDQDDWHISEAISSRLQEIGLEPGSAVRITLERYVPEEEYRNQPWRRDGLHRDRRWPLLERVVGFVGLAISLTCLLSLLPSTVSAAILWPLSLFILFQGQFTGWSLRSLVTRSDLTNGFEPQMPNLGVYTTLFEGLSWPLFVLVSSAGIYRLTLRWLRSASDNNLATASLGVLGSLRSAWYGGLLRRLDLIALVVGGAIFFTAIGSVLGIGIKPSRFTVQILTLPAMTLWIWYLTLRWDRRDPLLSRLPVRSTAIASKRLVWTHLQIAALALLPLAIEQAMPSIASSGSGILGSRTPSDPWLVSVMLFSFGSLSLLLALIGRVVTGSGIGAIYGILMALPLSMLALWIDPGLGLEQGAILLAVALPGSYLLIRRPVALGITPTLFGKWLHALR